MDPSRSFRDDATLAAIYRMRVLAKIDVVSQEAAGDTLSRDDVCRRLFQSSRRVSKPAKAFRGANIQRTRSV